MRNVVRDILTNWRNVFGKQMQYSYSFVVQNAYTTINAETSADVPVRIRETSIISGTEIQSVYNYPIANTPITLGGVADIGTIYTIAVEQGTLSYLEVDGVVIFDNR